MCQKSSHEVNTSVRHYPLWSVCVLDHADGTIVALAEAICFFAGHLPPLIYLQSGRDTCIYMIKPVTLAMWKSPIKILFSKCGFYLS